VTNLETPSRAVVRFYNKRVTAEQWIKEGKCHDAGPPLRSERRKRGANVPLLLRGQTRLHSRSDNPQTGNYNHRTGGNHAFPGQSVGPYRGVSGDG
jgi:hypothetical protein